jgi:3-hydroxyacyl-CoA dehydrogenase/enoyl-CoA hydratase/3-hydroxybutyryl-CoA epimerase
MAMDDIPELTQFRVEQRPGRIAHLVFDAPGRSMNVFSEAAIEDLGRFATWLAVSDATGVVVRSAKPAFCAGADLTELGVAYDMIMAAPKDARTKVAFDHFFRLSQALRRLETAGKPVAAAIGGLALGGGCELALACHHRVMGDAPQIFLGLPESLVGLLPGAGGTQRLPRLVGAAAALPVLLDGARLTATQALASGLVHAVTAPGDEVAVAEEWVRSNAAAQQPWDRADWKPVAPRSVAAIISARRDSALEETQGHYPAPIAILACLERGLPKSMEVALRTEMAIFARLIQRPEPRNMIQTLFLGKQDHARRSKVGDLPMELPALRAQVSSALAAVVREAKADGASDEEIAAGLREAGFTRPAETWANAKSQSPRPVPSAMGQETAGLWFEYRAKNPRQRLGRSLLRVAAEMALPHLAGVPAEDRRVIDYVLVTELGFPAYVGGPLALAAYLGDRMSDLA